MSPSPMDDLMPDDLTRESLARAIGHIEGSLDTIKGELSSIPAIEQRLAALEIAHTSMATDLAIMKPAVADWQNVATLGKWGRRIVLTAAGVIAFFGIDRIVQWWGSLK